MATTLLISALLVGNPLFVLQHAGETTDLIPVLEAFQQQGRSFSILAIGTAQELVKRVDCLASYMINDEEWNALSKQRPTEEGIEREKVQKIIDTLRPSCLITGVATEIQREFLLEAQARSIPSFAFWDNPEAKGTTPYFTQASKTAQAASTLFCPSDHVAQAFHGKQTLVVGKPSLKKKFEKIQAVNVPEVLNRISFNLKTPIITFLGTKGPGFAKAYHLFCTVLQNTPNQVIVQTHPQSDTITERDLASVFLGKNNSVISTKQEGRLSYEEAIAVADIVVTYDSSGGFDAFLAGKRVLYASPSTLTPKETFTNSLIKEGLANTFASKAEFNALLSQEVEQADTQDVMCKMGIPNPEDSTDLILHILTPFFESQCVSAPY